MLNLPVHSYELRSKPASSARLVNCFAEVMPAGGRSPVLLSRAPGIRNYLRVGSGPIHALYSAYIELDSGAAEYLYVVSGSELYYVDTDGVPTLIGDIGVPGNIDISSNVNHLVVVNAPRAYYWDGTTFGEITDEDLRSRGAGSVEFLDNYLLFDEPNTGRFYSADLGSAVNFSALNFATAETSPDNIIAIKAINRMLHVFGAKTLELWQNTGASGFPFERIVNATIEIGCKGAVAEIESQPYWLADDLTVRRLNGGVPERVSTHAVEQFITSATISSAEAFTYEQEGHFFYVLTFDEGTWIFDITTGEWHERNSYLKSNWLANCHAQFNNLETVGNRETNEVGRFDPEFYWEWGENTENIVLESSDLSDSGKWGPTYATITGDQKDPAGRIQAVKLNDDGSTGTGNVSIVSVTNLTFKANTDYVVSAKIKADQLDWVNFAIVDLSDVTGANCYFDVRNGVKGTPGADVNNSGMIAEFNDYWRCWFTFTTAADTSGRPRIYLADSDGDFTVDLDGSSSVILTDAQVERGVYPTAFLETGSEALSRLGTQVVEWTYQPVFAQGQRAFHNRIEIVMETGVGQTTGQGSSPLLQLEYSDDGGMTWMSLPSRSIGAIGKREQRAVWHNLGSSRQRVYRARCSDPIPLTVTDTLLEVDGGQL